VKNLLSKEVDCFRLRGDAVKDIYGWDGDGTCGAFFVPQPHGGRHLLCIASSEGNWDHVSVSMKSKCPSWNDMSHVRRLFFKPEETVMELHVPNVEHINFHPYCLHLWRPQAVPIPLPPSIFVGPSSAKDSQLSNSDNKPAKELT
jgi:hypothetical protein